MKSQDPTSDFLKAARRGNPVRLQTAIDEGASINEQDPLTGLTALHIVAAGGARKALRVLFNAGEVDFLIRDKEGRLASELAYLHGRDVAMARLLGIKERKQADAEGVRLTRRPKVA